MQLKRRLLQWKLAKETFTRQIKVVHRGGNQIFTRLFPDWQDSVEESSSSHAIEKVSHIWKRSEYLVCLVGTGKWDA